MSSDIIIKDNNKEINIKLGLNFKILLKQQGSAGYTWSSTFDQSLIELLSSKVVHPNITPSMGSSSIREFLFKTKQKGKTEILFTYKQPWKKDSIEEKKFNITIS